MLLGKVAQLVMSEPGLGPGSFESSVNILSNRPFAHEAFSTSAHKKLNSSANEDTCVAWTGLIIYTYL